MSFVNTRISTQTINSFNDLDINQNLIENLSKGSFKVRFNVFNRSLLFRK